MTTLVDKIICFGTYVVAVNVLFGCTRGLVTIFKDTYNGGDVGVITWGLVGLYSGIIIPAGRTASNSIRVYVSEKYGGD